MMKNNISLEECFELYWKELKKTVTYGGFDCVGHFDFPKRYYKDLIYSSEIILEIMSIVIKNNLILEINTSSLRKGLSSTMPDNNLLDLYKQVGGQYVTIGSDAHSCEELGANIDTAKKIIEKLDLSEVIYEKRQRKCI